MIYYTNKSLILLENRLVIVTGDGIFNGALVKLQHCRTLPRPSLKTMSPAAFGSDAAFFPAGTMASYAASAASSVP